MSEFDAEWARWTETFNWWGRPVNMEARPLTREMLDEALARLRPQPLVGGEIRGRENRIVGHLAFWLRPAVGRR